MCSVEDCTPCLNRRFLECRDPSGEAGPWFASFTSIKSNHRQLPSRKKKTPTQDITFYLEVKPLYFCNRNRSNLKSWHFNCTTIICDPPRVRNTMFSILYHVGYNKIEMSFVHGVWLMGGDISQYQLHSFETLL